MVVIHVAVGQCGNQVTADYYKLWQSKNQQEFEQMNCVFVDTESKVLHKVAVSSQNTSVISGKCGRGSNWAYGYFGDRRESSLISDTVSTVRKQVERSDYFSGIVMLHSLAGGTGSGLGSRLSEELREEFTMESLMNVVVVPHSTDKTESPLQHYNSLFCLSHLHSISDGMMLFFNDGLVQYLQSKLSGDGSVNQKQMNRCISQHLVGLLSPCSSLYNTRDATNELLRSVCPMSNLKLMRCARVSGAQVSCDSLVQSSRLLTHIRRPQDDLRSHLTLRGTLSAVLCARGPSAVRAALTSTQQNIINKYLQPVSWNKKMALDLWIHSQPKEQTVGKLSSLTLAFNSGCVTDYLCSVHHSAKTSFTAGAFLHWYEKHGAARSEFENAFGVFENVVADYSSMM